MCNVEIYINDKKYIIPLVDYLDIKAIQYGFDDYEDLCNHGFSIDFQIKAQSKCDLSHFDKLHEGSGRM